MKKKLSAILKIENQDNYDGFGFYYNMLISHRERMLARIERAVFGNANIQKKEFKKFIKKHPQFKNGLDFYSTKIKNK